MNLLVPNAFWLSQCVFKSALFLSSKLLKSQKCKRNILHSDHFSSVALQKLKNGLNWRKSYVK